LYDFIGLPLTLSISHLQPPPRPHCTVAIPRGTAATPVLWVCVACIAIRRSAADPASSHSSNPINTYSSNSAAAYQMSEKFTNSASNYSKIAVTTIKGTGGVAGAEASAEASLSLSFLPLVGQQMTKGGLAGK